MAQRGTQGSRGHGRVPRHSPHRPARDDHTARPKVTTRSAPRRAKEKKQQSPFVCTRERAVPKTGHGNATFQYKQAIALFPTRTLFANAEVCMAVKNKKQNINRIKPPHGALGAPPTPGIAHLSHTPFPTNQNHHTHKKKVLSQKGTLAATQGALKNGVFPMRSSSFAGDGSSAPLYHCQRRPCGALGRHPRWATEANTKRVPSPLISRGAQTIKGKKKIMTNLQQRPPSKEKNNNTITATTL